MSCELCETWALAGLHKLPDVQDVVQQRKSRIFMEVVCRLMLKPGWKNNSRVHLYLCTPG